MFRYKETIYIQASMPQILNKFVETPTSSQLFPADKRTGGEHKPLNILGPTPQWDKNLYLAINHFRSEFPPNHHWVYNGLCMVLNAASENSLV